MGQFSEIDIEIKELRSKLQQAEEKNKFLELALNHGINSIALIASTLNARNKDFNERFMSDLLSKQETTENEAGD